MKSSFVTNHLGYNCIKVFSKNAVKAGVSHQVCVNVNKQLIMGVSPTRPTVVRGDKLLNASR